MCSTAGVTGARYGAAGTCGGVVPGVGAVGGYPGEGYYPSAARSSCKGNEEQLGNAKVRGYCPVRQLVTVPVPNHAFLRPPRHSGPPWGLRTPGLPALKYPPWSQYRRDSIIYILKLVQNSECHRFSSMRPAMLPISETGPNITTLNFQDFHIR